MSRYLFNLTVKGNRKINAQRAATVPLMREIVRLWNGLDMTLDELTRAINQHGLALSQSKVAAVLRGDVANVDLLKIFAQAMAGVELQYRVQYGDLVSLSMREIMDRWMALLNVSRIGERGLLGKTLGVNQSSLYKWYALNRKPAVMRLLYAMEKRIHEAAVPVA